MSAPLTATLMHPPAPAVPTALDHLVVASADLERDALRFADEWGIAFAARGEHRFMGTHNRIARIGAHAYLELIAVDPTLPAPGRPRWFGLDEPELVERLSGGARLIHWVARCADLAQATAAAPLLGDILEARRDAFSWQLTLRADGHLPFDGLAPSLIRWTSPSAPGEVLPASGVSLTELHAETPAHEALAGLCQSLEIDWRIVPAAAARLCATFDTPRGPVTLEGP